MSQRDEPLDFDFLYADGKLTLCFDLGGLVGHSVRIVGSWITRVRFLSLMRLLFSRLCVMFYLSYLLMNGKFLGMWERRSQRVRFPGIGKKSRKGGISLEINMNDISAGYLTLVI